MLVNVQIDTNAPLTTRDLDLLHALTGLDKADVAAEPAATPEKAAPAAKKAAAKKPAAKKAAAAPAPEPEPEESEVDADALRAKALEIAGSLLAAGQRETVAAALAEVGAPKVSEIPDDSLADFIAALEG